MVLVERPCLNRTCSISYTTVSLNSKDLVLVYTVYFTWATSERTDYSLCNENMFIILDFAC